MKIIVRLFIIILSLNAQVNAQTITLYPATNGFKIIPLGVKGGLDESNLSAYLVAASGSDQFICLDAGTIYKGLELAAAKKLFKSSNPSTIQQQQINGYFISHAHLDHTAGLIMNSPNDNAKNLYGLASVLDVFKKNYFTWSAWANFGNEGEAPILKKYSYQTLIPKVEVPIDKTGLFVTPFVLSHVKPYESTAFLIRNQNSYLLYLGDTGADKVEQSQQLAALWKYVAPLVMNKQLKAIFIEVSFDNSVSEKAGLEKALAWVKGITAVPEVGDVYEGPVKGIKEFGAFIEFMPGKQGLLHISEISWSRLETMDGVFNEGDMVKVKLVGLDPKTGKFKLSHKALIPRPGAE